MSTCNSLDLEAPGYRPIMPKISLDNDFKLLLQSCHHDLWHREHKPSEVVNSWQIYLPRAEAPVTKDQEKYKVVPSRKIGIKSIINFFGNYIHEIEIIVSFWNQKLVRTYYECLEYAITTHFNCSLLTLTHKSRTCVMALLVLSQSKFNPNLM